jgi:V/A-type H+-transporting ATPase subunit E
MEGIQRIKERILEGARQEADKKIKDAEKKAQEILEKARKDAENRKKKLLEKAARDAEDIKAKMISMAELDMKKNLLAVKQDMVDRAFQQALEKLKNMETVKYEEILTAMILQAVETGEEEIILSKRDLGRLSKDFITKLNNLRERRLNLKLSRESRDIEGGFILKSRRVETNSSFESIMRMERDNIESRIAGILFED